jgi:hypothetical protein
VAASEGALFRFVAAVTKDWPSLQLLRMETLALGVRKPCRRIATVNCVTCDGVRPAGMTVSELGVLNRTVAYPLVGATELSVGNVPAAEPQEPAAAPRTNGRFRGSRLASLAATIRRIVLKKSALKSR